MNQRRSLLVAVILVVFAAVACNASDIYIAQNATGSNTGADCADAHAFTFFNNSSNWNSNSVAGKIGPGTTIHLCGTFTAPAGASGFLTVQGSGTSGNPITIHFESGAMIQAPYWAGQGAIYSSGKSYITVDGGTPCGPGTACSTSDGSGIIQATLAGSIDATCIGGPCTYHSVSGDYLIYLRQCNNCEIRNMVLRDEYVHTAHSNDPSGGNALILIGNNTNVDNNTMHDTAWALNTPFPSGASNISNFNNYIYNVDHGIAVGDMGPGSTLAGLYIYGNVIRDFANWDTSSDYWHHDGVHIYANNASTVSPPMMIYNNTFSGNWGGNDNTGIYIEFWAVAGANVGTHYVFNNIFARSGGGCANGAIGELNGSGGAGMNFFNNTMTGVGTAACGIDVAYGSSALATGANIENNIYSGNGANGSVGIIDTLGGSSIAASNYNDWYGTYNGDGMRYNEWYVSPSSWSSATGFDANSLQSNPNLSSKFGLTKGSPAIGAGTNLYSTCNGMPVPGLGALCADNAGNPRPSSGNWDLGAHSFIVPASPSNLTGTVVVN